MRLCPSAYQLEKVIRLYEDGSFDGVKWQQFNWLYQQLGCIARSLTYFGVMHSAWWRRSFVLPILCREANLVLQAFLEGAWTKAEEPVLGVIFDFCAREIHSAPDLFDIKIRAFLLTKKPSFSQVRDEALLELVSTEEGRDFAWKSAETYKDYSRRLSVFAFKASPGLKGQQPVLAQVPLEPIREESIHRWKNLLQQIPELMGMVVDLEKEIVALLKVAKAVRRQEWDLCSRLMSMKKSAEEMLSALEAHFPSLELVRSQLSGPYFAKVCVLESVLLARIRQNCGVMHDELFIEKERIFRIKEEFSQLVRQLTKCLDSVPVVLVKNAFKAHQLRVLKEAREILKEYRQSFVKGVDIGLNFDEGRQKIMNLAALAGRFYDEGMQIEALQKRFEVLQNRLEALPGKGGLKQKLRNLFEEYEKNFEFSCQRGEELDHIESLLCGLQ